MKTAIRNHLGAWMLVPMLAALNGSLRDATYGRWLDRTLAHSIAVLPLATAIVLWQRWIARRWPLSSVRAAVGTGCAWLVLTVVTELALGAARGIPLAEALAEYDISRGNLWVFVPLACGLGPIVVGLRVYRASVAAS